MAKKISFFIFAPTYINERGELLSFYLTKANVDSIFL